MAIIDAWLATAAVFGATLTVIFYYRNAGTSLEVRTNQIVKDKKKIVIRNYENLLEKIFESYKN